MIHLELTCEEEQYLEEELQHRLADLEHEIAHTDSLDFKNMLKRRRESVRRFLAKLPDSMALCA